MNLSAYVAIAVIAVAIGVYFSRHRDAQLRSHFLMLVGFVALALFFCFLGLFILGETLTDPGGWAGLGLAALWMAPLAVMLASAWWLPEVATWVLSILVAAAIGLGIWFAVDPDGWRSFEDEHGPVRTIAVWAIAGALGLLGLKRTGAAGVLLLVVGIVPVTISTLGQAHVMASLAMASTTPVVTGVLYVWSAVLARRTPPPEVVVETFDRPKAA